MKINTIVEFIEPTCPYCWYVYKFILNDILVRRVELNQKMHQMKINKYIPPFDIQLVDVTANRGVIEEQWFSWYSRKIGGRYTPVVKINDTGFYLWGGDKPAELEQESLSRTDKLKRDIISEVTEEIFEKREPLYNKELMHNIRGIL